MVVFLATDLTDKHGFLSRIQYENIAKFSFQRYFFYHLSHGSGKDFLNFDYDYRTIKKNKFVIYQVDL